ncbi:hypothetical protein NDU88_007990 [Pleurodeles waltl]|uniref:Uncharacterized protein n=1 Tax=Pleurodeles waltl TaxID=8319 RepID=A0AAV7SUB1_PLEWA|nr:hypothetical protein NDU88_007990 [Pleurodeles waltl]
MIPSLSGNAAAPLPDTARAPRAARRGAPLSPAPRGPAGGGGLHCVGREGPAVTSASPISRQGQETTQTALGCGWLATALSSRLGGVQAPPVWFPVCDWILPHVFNDWVEDEGR